MFRRLAAVSQEFLQKVRRCVATEVWRSPAFKAGKKYLTVHCIKDPRDPKDPGYYYVERVGKDSVGFLLLDEERGDAKWGVLQQWHGPLKKFGTGAFTGSCDKDDCDTRDITQEEAVEEAGYDVPLEQILPIGVFAVSAMTNEEVHLFVVDVRGIDPDEIQPENIFEANTFTKWMTEDEVLSRCEWKARMIVQGYRSSEELAALGMFNPPLF